MDAPLAMFRPFHLGMSEDGQRCRIVFVDEQRHFVEYVADFAEFTSFVTTLCDAAAEMVKRRRSNSEQEAVQYSAMDIASAAFKPHPTDGTVVGVLVSPSGEVVGLRMQPEIACRVSRDLLLASPAVLAS